MFRTGGVIKCLLCQGAVEAEEKEYRRHLKNLHKVWFFMTWIIQKTKEQNECLDGEDNDDFGYNEMTNNTSVDAYLKVNKVAQIACRGEG